MRSVDVTTPTRHPSKTLAWAVLGELDQVLGLTGRIFDTKDLAKRHLREGDSDLGLGRDLPEGGLGIVNAPIQFQTALATQRRVAGDGGAGARRAYNRSVRFIRS